MNAKTNSLQRIGLLLKMEWDIKGVWLLIFYSIMALCMAGFQEVNYYTRLQNYTAQDTMKYLIVKANEPKFFVFVFVSVFIFLITINRRVNKPELVAYPVLPANVWEKYVVMFIEAIIFYLLACFFTQLSITITYFLHYNIFTTSHFPGRDFLFGYLSGGYPCINPLYIFKESYESWVIGALLLSILLFSAISMGKPIKAIVLNGIILFIIGILSINILPYTLKTLDIPPSSRDDIHVAILGITAIVFFIWSYLKLRMKQLKQ